MKLGMVALVLLLWSGLAAAGERYPGLACPFCADGTLVHQWGTTSESGIDEGEFRSPADVAIAPDRSPYFADYGTRRVQTGAKAMTTHRAQDVPPQRAPT